MNALSKKYGDKVAVYVVYIREAHPSDGWQVRKNERDGVVFKQPKTEGERAEVASACVVKLAIKVPCLIDDVKASAQQAYSAWPDRVYVVARDGTIAFKGEPGPRGFSVAAAEAALKKVLAGS